jgi:dTDP-4-amino-4,6-dideoxygalactose transaminase
MQENIPCLDLKGQHQQVKEEVFDAFEKVYAKTAFAGGPFVAEFEEKFAEFCSASYAVGVNNGTNAIHLALRALDVGTGDEVIIPANTFIATAWAVSYVGATPVFVDCLSDTWEIDPDQVEGVITDNTKAIIGVHLYGQPFDFDSVKTIADKHNLPLLEDAAQAHGAEYKGRRIGSMGDLACFSFYPGKNLGACGEGGGITTNNKDYAAHIARLRNHGSDKRYYHDELGYNMRMGGLEGASLKVKLKYLEGWNDRRRAIAERYLKEVHNENITMQFQPDFARSVFHLFVVTVKNRDHFIDYLSTNNINPGLHYPVPCHLQKAYSHLGHQKGDFPNSEHLASHCVSLPMYAELNDEQVAKVIELLNDYQDA